MHPAWLPGREASRSGTPLKSCGRAKKRPITMAPMRREVPGGRSDRVVPQALDPGSPAGEATISGGRIAEVPLEAFAVLGFSATLASRGGAAQRFGLGFRVSRHCSHCGVPGWRQRRFLAIGCRPTGRSGVCRPGALRCEEVAPHVSAAAASAVGQSG